MNPLLSFRCCKGPVRRSGIFDVPLECTSVSCWKKCHQFYEKVFAQTNVDFFCRCPFGYSVYVTNVNAVKTAFYGMRVKGIVARDKKAGRGMFLPVLDQAVVKRIVLQEVQRNNEAEKCNRFERFRAELIHGMEKILSTCCARSESLLSFLENDEHEDVEGVPEHIRCGLKTILMGNIQLRNQFYVAKLRFGTGIQNRTYKTMVYNKFYKAKKMLNKYQGRSVHIELVGESYNKYHLTASFEMLPYLLLENAVKYSPDGGVVKVEFNEYVKNLEINIKNIGPTTRKTHDELCQDGARGENSTLAKIDGSGIGLFTCDNIARLNGIDFKVIPGRDEDSVINGVPYSSFVVKIRLPEAVFAEKGRRSN